MTAELAVALPAVMLVLAGCLGGIALAGQYVRVQDAAAAAARELGRGGDPVVAARLVPGSSVEQWHEADLVCVRVSLSATVGSVAFPLAATSCALSGGL